jgi:EAL domain-containing protein (putative c-di-GMP-specific phosphodiesterase class I)/DNA-binding NarL/FixJ family response regulator
MTSSASTAPGAGSLLVVDDSAVQRGHAAALCRQLGVDTIHEAASGAEALVLLARLAPPPALAIVDLEMPVMDGIEFIQRLAQGPHALPLVVVSGREQALIETVETMAHGLGLTVLAALRKPLRLQALADALAAVDAAERAARPAEQAPEPRIDAAALERAITADRIDVHVQPKVDMLTGLVRGVEVLARWTNDEGAAVRPDRFVALAEREGLILALTRRVMARAFAQAAYWNARGLRLAMAVNVSPRLLEAPGLVEEICVLVAHHGLRPEQVVFEITESSVVEGLGAALGVLARLRLQGFGLSIDDYGTGFSSMQQLARVPFTELKVDRSFVHEASRRDNLRVILQSAVDMARQLGLVTVAEGIETMEDWRLVQQCGCHIGQGWLIARAMPAADLLPWIRNHQRRLPGLRPQRADATR